MYINWVIELGYPSQALKRRKQKISKYHLKSIHSVSAQI
jgi:hypothetical protein